MCRPLSAPLTPVPVWSDGLQLFQAFISSSGLPGSECPAALGTFGLLCEIHQAMLNLKALALWPCCWRSMSNDAVYTSGYKSWEEEIVGSKSLGSGAASGTKSRSSVELCAFFSLSLKETGRVN
ncbi:hypothetical protein ATANTOWER_027198 [Ataeniobius toweri]|uniref:Uncharacterized protein n=1 Tax=Ataeniobius toweri TaxID=208326 RepID=A0ABU7C733_9TELE|nr:hypothetical protein [Ataeniobius toweri]